MKYEYITRRINIYIWHERRFFFFFFFLLSFFLFFSFFFFFLSTNKKIEHQKVFWIQRFIFVRITFLKLLNTMNSFSVISANTYSSQYIYHYQLQQQQQQQVMLIALSFLTHTIHVQSLSLQAGPLDCIQCQHRADVCNSLLDG